jgi:DNA-binding transcriptional LysR family regulator
MSQSTVPLGPPLALERSITLHQLRTFKAVADHLSFSAAALDLRLSQPSVSYQVKELESALGMDLLDRLGKRVQLTQAGHLLYGYARRTLNLLDEAALALDELRGMERGTLKVGASTTVGIYIIPAALGAFKRIHSGLNISLEIGNRGQVQERVLRNELDLAVVGPPLKNPDLVSLPFMFDELVIVAPSDHRLAGRKLSLKDLRDEPFIMREAGSGTRWAVEKAFRKAGIHVPVGMELGSNGAIKHAVESGLGLAALSRYAIPLERSSGRLTVLEVEGFPIRRQWHIVHLRRQRLAAPVSGFIEFLRSSTWLDGALSGPRRSPTD